MEKLDLSYLESITDGDRDLIIELIDIFKSQVPEFIDQFDTAFAKKDTDSLRRIAHKAKSSVAVIGLNELTILLSKFETEVEERPFSFRFQSYIDTFSEHCYKALEILDKHYR